MHQSEKGWGGALPGGVHSIFKDKKAPKSVACLGSCEQLRKAARSPGNGCYSLTTGSCRICKVSIDMGYISIGVFKQGRKSDFCFGKEDSGPGSEQLLCPHREGFGSETLRQAFLGLGQRLPAGPCLWPGVLLAAWVSQLSALLAGHEGGGKGWPGGGTHFLLPPPTSVCRG